MVRFFAAIALACVGFGQTPPPASRFVFQNNFWLNLHQFLRGEVYRRGAKLAPGLDPAPLTEKDRAAWNAAVDAYVEFSKRDLLADGAVHNGLVPERDAATLSPAVAARIGEKLAATLNSVAPIYRERLWPARQRDNDAWIERVKPLLARYETRVAAEVASTFHITWPTGPVLVDAVGEIGPNSAITHDGPPGYSAHVQAGAASPRNVGDAPLELLFHEACHVPACAGKLSQMIVEESQRQKLLIPFNLWHELMMYTPGVIVKRILAADGKEYASYTERYRQLAPEEYAAFERDWLPYLDGKASFEQALHDVVRDASR